MRKLVIFYSHGGNTHKIARKIAALTGADIAEIHTVKEYTDDYDMLISLGEREVQSGYMPELRETYDLSSYDVVFLGAPVWSGSFAPAMGSLIYRQNWKGKQIFPFVTYDTRIGRVAGDFKRSVKGAEVSKPLAVKFDGTAQETPDELIVEWLKECRQYRTEKQLARQTIGYMLRPVSVVEPQPPVKKTKTIKIVQEGQLVRIPKGTVKTVSKTKTADKPTIAKKTPMKNSLYPFKPKK